MALKDLVADHKKITEEAIEKVVAPFVRYDPAAKKIVWTVEGRSLSNDTKILVYLVAVLGWQYVIDQNHKISTKPGDLESEIGITGNTLRPILKRLKDSHLLVVADGHYRVQLANIEYIEAIAKGAAPKLAAKVNRPKNKNIGERENSKEKKTVNGAPRALKPFLEKLFSSDFFKEPKTLADILVRYHEHGLITKQSSLSGLLLDAVRHGSLARKRIGTGGKTVWAYQSRAGA